MQVKNSASPTMLESSSCARSDAKEPKEPSSSVASKSDQTTPLGGVAIGAVLLVASNVAQQVLVAITGLIIVRSTDPSGYGYYATALALAAAFSGLFVFGLEAIVSRESAQNPRSTSVILSTSLSITVLWSPLVLGLIWGVASRLSYSQETMELLRPVLVVVWGRAAVNLLRAALRGLNRMELDSLTRVVEGLTGLVFVVVLLRALGSVMSAALALALAALLTLACSAWLVKRVVQGPYSFDRCMATKLVRAAVPVGVASSIQLLYWKLDTLLLSLLMPVGDVGLFSAAFNTVMLSYGVSLAIISALFPTLSILALRDIHRFRQAVDDGLRYVLLVSLPAGALMAVLASQIVTLLYGAAFIESAGAVAVLGLMIPLMFVRVFLWGALLATGKQNLLVPTVLAGLVVMLALCFLLIPELGIIGAAIADVGSEACIALLLGWFLWRQVGSIRIIRAAASPLFSTTILVACLWLLRSHLDWWLLVPLATAGYCATLLATKGIRPGELSSALSGLTKMRQRIHARR